MDIVRKQLDKIKPLFKKGGKFGYLHSLFDGLETFLFVPNTTSKHGTHIHDMIDSKRTMILVVLGLVPALLFGMYNVGYQHYLAIGQAVGFWDMFLYGMLAVVPIVVVSYAVGLGLEIFIAQIKGGHEVHEGVFVTAFLIPLIVPVDTPLWMIAVATAFAVLFAKEVFGGTGMNIFNVALVTRAFLFFAYPTFMSGDVVWVRTADTFGIGAGQVVDGYSGATVLGQVATSVDPVAAIHGITGQPFSFLDGLIGLIPGSIGETSFIALFIGAALLMVTGVASWKIILSIFLGGGAVAWLFNVAGPDTAAANFAWYNHLVYGGFALGAFFMATDPVTGARTEKGKWIYGLLIGAMAIVIRVLNPGYPEGMMLAILLLNIFAPLIDYYVVDANVKARLKRAKTVK